MAQDQDRYTRQFEWPIAAVEGQAARLISKKVSQTKDLGLPTQTTELHYEVTVQVGKATFVTVVGATEAEMTANLNELRVAVIAARDALPAM